ncbi:uncharacterized protein LOC119333648 [Triticum dicoccoides]|uniref:uncharacterized protein LOC119333648 n=1 Tax=Triticum dicoccoides TaxID=85692 RepID=UPI001891E271|nr:uncharacterized protein LOC119333648 [Triticum dicoccoides]
MDFSLFPWPFRRRAGGSSSGGTGPSKPSAAEGKEELSVTPQLLDFLRTLSPDAFKSAVLCFVVGESAESAAELSDWQQRHAILVLARAKELAKVRYDLCPRHMKDKQFWTYILS